MNPLPDSNKNRNNEKIAKGHWQNILYALNKLEDAKCGAITKSVNDKVTRKSMMNSIPVMPNISVKVSRN